MAIVPLLTKEQIKLASKYYAASNTGLIGCGFEKPTTKDEIERVYSQISYEYEVNLGEDLEEERKMWEDDFAEVGDNDYNYKTIKKDIPFILEA